MYQRKFTYIPGVCPKMNRETKRFYVHAGYPELARFPSFGHLAMCVCRSLSRCRAHVSGQLAFGALFRGHENVKFRLENEIMYKWRVSEWRRGDGGGRGRAKEAFVKRTADFQRPFRFSIYFILFAIFVRLLRCHRTFWRRFSFIFAVFIMYSLNSKYSFSFASSLRSRAAKHVE